MADACRLPFAPACFDRLFSSYLFDLIPLAEVPALIAGCRRVLKPGGHMALVSLTEGINPMSRVVMGLWKTCYALRPLACGGCRPLQLATLVEAAGFVAVSREVVVQKGVPSEINNCRRRAGLTFHTNPRRFLDKSLVSVYNRSE